MFFECDLCPLHSYSKYAVSGEGPNDAKIMLIGEAPGRNEARLGRPFVGQSGKLLETMLDAAGLARNEVYITNTVKHRPPENRTPLETEISACAIHLNAEWKRIHPRVTVLVGGTASKALFKVSATKANGLWRHDGTRTYVGMVHPAYLLRGRPQSEIEEVVEILKRVKEYAYA
jgi:DNA polymerase